MKTTRAEALFDESFADEVAALVDAHPDARDWSAAGRGKTKKQPDGEDGTWWRANGPGMVQAWMDWRREVGWTIWTAPDGSPGIELPIEVDLPGTDEQVWMVIDRVFNHPNGGLIIVDLKTGARSPESDLQLGVYRYGLLRKYGAEADLGAYWMARVRGELVPFGLQRYTVDLVETWFRRFVQAKNDGVFLPHPTFRCRACAMRDYCAAYGGPKSYMDPDAAKADDVTASVSETPKVEGATQ